MSDYYNYIRIGQLFNINNENRTVSYTGTPYYRQIIETIRKCIHIRGFPILNAKQIYAKIMPENKPIIETYYPTYQWNYIWGNLSSVFILLKEREVLFKFLHEVLPTKKETKGDENH